MRVVPDVELCLKEMQCMRDPYCRGNIRQASREYENVCLLSDDDRDSVSQAYMEALLLEGIGSRRGHLLLFCVSDIIMIECEEVSDGGSWTDRCHALVAGMADAIVKGWSGGHSDGLDAQQQLHDWWTCVCSSLVSVIVSLSDRDQSLATWMVALLLSCGRCEMMCGCPDLHVMLLQTVFGITFTTVSTSARAGMYQTWSVYYGMIHAGIDDVVSGEGMTSLSSGILFACLTGIIVSLPPSTAESIMETRLYHQYSRSVLVDNSDAVVACGMALSHVYKRHTRNGSTQYSTICMLRASVAILYGYKHNVLNRTSHSMPSSYYRNTLPRCLIDILSKKPPLSMQPWLLEEMRSLAINLFNTEGISSELPRVDHKASCQSVFEFSLQVIDCVTRGMTVMHPAAPALIADLLGYLNAWRPPHDSTTFKRIIVPLIDIFERIPGYTKALIHTMQKEVVTPGKAGMHSIQASRMHLLLSLLLPCCDKIDSELIAKYLGPYCVSLLWNAWDHVPLTLVASDMCCRIIVCHHGLPPERIHGLSIEYITQFIEMFSLLRSQKEMRSLKPLSDCFASGFVTIVMHCPISSQLEYLDVVLEACYDMMGDTTQNVSVDPILYAIFQAAAYCVGTVALENVPYVCSRLKRFFQTLQSSSPKMYHGCRTLLFNVIQNTEDITRLPYLAEHFTDIVYPAPASR